MNIGLLCSNSNYRQVMFSLNESDCKEPHIAQLDLSVVDQVLAWPISGWEYLLPVSTTRCPLDRRLL